MVFQVLKGRAVCCMSLIALSLLRAGTSWVALIELGRGGTGSSSLVCVPVPADLNDYKTNQAACQRANNRN